MRRLIYGIFFLIILAFAITFAAKNHQPVEVQYYLGFLWHGSLSMLLFSVLGVGVILGVLFTFTWVVKAKRKIARSQREVRKMEQEVANLRALPVKDLE